MEKLIITAAVGGMPTHLPAPPNIRDLQVFAQEVVDCCNAGASVTHIRLPNRPETGEPEIERWAELTSLMRSRCDIVIKFGGAMMAPRLRKPLLALRPDISSLVMGAHRDFLPSLEDQRELARYHLEAGVLVDGELWHTGNVWSMNRLIEDGLLQPPHFVSLFFGRPGHDWVPPTAQELHSRLAVLPPETRWTIEVHGPEQLHLHAQAILLGGHVRTALESEADLEPGRPAQRTAELVERITRLARELGRDVATPQEVRELCGIPRPPRP